MNKIDSNYLINLIEKSLKKNEAVIEKVQKESKETIQQYDWLGVALLISSTIFVLISFILIAGDETSNFYDAFAGKKNIPLRHATTDLLKAIGLFIFYIASFIGSGVALFYAAPFLLILRNISLMTTIAIGIWLRSLYIRITKTLQYIIFDGIYHFPQNWRYITLSQKISDDPELIPGYTNDFNATIFKKKVDEASTLKKNWATMF